jgi:PAS domain S-box-containing protein
LAAQLDPEFLASLIDGDTLYHNAPCGYFSCLPDGTFIKINRTLLNWLGYTEGDLIGKASLTDLFSKGGKIYYQMFHYPLIQLKGKVNELNYDIHRKDHSFFPALLNTSAIRDVKGQLLAINIIVTDISDRKKYEAELLRGRQMAEAERKEFEFVANFIPEMIWTAEADGKINYVNKRFLDHFNVRHDQLNQNLLSSGIHQEDRSLALRRWVGGIRAEANFEVQFRLKERSGDYEWYLLKGSPYRNETGAITKWLGSCTNIDAHVRELKKRDEFISITSHELKTPVTTLRAAIQILGRQKDMPPIYQQMINQSNRSVARISQFIEELLNVNRLNEGQIQLNKRSFDLLELSETCRLDLQAATTTKLELVAEGRFMIIADPDRIEQVIANFVNNAIKYAPNSSAIQMKLVKQDAFIRFSVIDQGLGIAPEKLPHLFERYYRADHAGTQYSGLGLGLYICAELIKRHNGQIGVESILGQGSEFWFTLPL